MTDTTTDALTEMRDMVNSSELGPAAVSLVGTDDTPVLTVALTCDDTQRAHRLHLWTTLIAVDDATCGKYCCTEETLRLHLRGTFPHGGLVVVTALFNEHTDAAACQFITDHIEDQNIPVLLAGLGALETGGQP